MPRPQSHIIADAAIRAFHNIIPEGWVVRPVSPDYGIDLMVEIFHDTFDTGLTFFVQSKGTKIDKRSRIARIKSDKLRYLNLFDAPSIIFRHCKSTGENYWKWSRDAEKNVDLTKKEVSVKFEPDDLWGEETCEKIHKYLFYRRVVEQRLPWTTFPLVRCVSDLSDGDLEAFIDPLRRELFFFSGRTGEDHVPLKLEFYNNVMRLSAAEIAEVTVEVKGTTRSDRKNALAYLLLGMMRKLRFDRHAEKIAQTCLEQGLVPPSRALLAEAALSMISVPSEAVQLAVDHGLHRELDEYFHLFSLALRKMEDSAEKASDHVVKIYTAAIDSASPDQNSGSLCYTFANYYRSVGNYASSIKYYNKARKYSKFYMDLTYYWRDVGGVLFKSKHYNGSARAYERLNQLESVPTAKYLYADALMASRRYDKAIEIFSLAASDQSSVGAEAELKRQVCVWLQANVDPSDRDVLSKALQLRSDAIADGDRNSVLFSHLAVSFYWESDVNCWADAIFLALLHSPHLLEMILMCACRAVGLEAYFLMKEERSDFIAQLGSHVGELDQLAIGLNFAVQNEPPYIPGSTIGEADRLAELGIFRLVKT